MKKLQKVMAWLGALTALTFHAAANEPEIRTGENCDISFGWDGHPEAALTEWESYELTITTTDKELNRAKAGMEEFATTKRTAVFSVKGFRGGDENFMDLVKAGGMLTGIKGDDLPSTNQEWADEFGIPLAQYDPSRWSCNSKKVSQSSDPGTWELEFKYGRRKTSVGGGNGSGSSSG